MATKYIVSLHAGASKEKALAMHKRLADFLGVPAETVLILSGASVAPVEVPDVKATYGLKEISRADADPGRRAS